MSQAASRTVVVLAAGEGKRMKSATPKVLQPLLGRTLLGHVLHVASEIHTDRTVVVVGHKAEQITAFVGEVAPDAVPVLQAEQNGTGHAVRIALDATPDLTGTVVVLSGDVPLLRPETVEALLVTHEKAGAAATVLSAEVEVPGGLGRIVRGVDGNLERIVEAKDATDEQRRIQEINSGIYAFDAVLLREALGKLSTDNAQGEEYLTDVFGILAGQGHPVAIEVAEFAYETLGCNDRAELAKLRVLMRDRVNEAWMRSGVLLLDPATTWIDVTATLEPDAVVDQNSQILGTTTVATGAVIGPDTTLIDTTVGAGATLLRTHSIGALVGPEATVGPYSYLRPGTKMGRKSKVGGFVETKNAELGDGAKVPHLTYAGDATIGAKANIGAGTIFANYDGVKKYHTTVGEAAFVGSDSVLIAPVEIGPGAYVAAGSAVQKSVGAGELGVSRAQQRNIEGWVARKRPGTASAEAAAKATDTTPEQD
ncbi:bifunctional UDP-N-acetylglucosamine diphosphorylase/glucosamine-1-phosphate N-acetyltransferase GlmU [Actinoplanes couchii]|uniref:Bifunctional protein GlmU n=1 Tax=Actinoplanes couchii TaxID=403638 RepID=A0ABQ3X9U6_9ACTN|nr:bifunctional UDP-N-acetylglucosamine diphosphorylase/glucosamine-1-phosphate N-acetyltransferase GlmU [Actinoplanes couchii]MDR6325089.1 bifunctional UDP-N-acetylglucosamine pyrophosphorylase/glucosamine-1-phosphate N-acetyltransferase [Actinoplanes couchii]GID55286.1 bifunctional protein GlmU [Actinoplanes couchii]